MIIERKVSVDRFLKKLWKFIFFVVLEIMSKFLLFKDWKYLVDLLIYAHHCFTICCDMEGIVGILKAARISTKLLASSHQYNLLVRLLTHVGRFKEMFYVIETLYNHHHFESLCRKGILNVFSVFYCYFRSVLNFELELTVRILMYVRLGGI